MKMLTLRTSYNYETMATTWWNNDHRGKYFISTEKDRRYIDKMSPRGERQGGDGERERVKLTALVPVPI